MAEPMMAATADRAVSVAAIDREERYYLASQWQLMWRKFRRHRLAMASVSVLALLYLVAIFAEFFAPYDPNRRFADYPFLAPVRVRMFHDGALTAPFVYGVSSQFNADRFVNEYVVDRTQRYPLRLFAR